ncbi:UV-stimulated scaffold protein A isoform X2 [Denticeps clupeoides]|uniref:UV-stimulated scaffold protein A n=1 Tax=Denticeps clupeoides TaxID=299321 RepID=A0AAY4F134_9TELE|nr:UV-stimulated scaffold protein A isoform X2 [Denticeps clupeoides]
MDGAKRDELSNLVEELTTSGNADLNPSKMKAVKKICKLSNVYIDHFYHLIMSQLSQDHCQIRLSAFQMASEIFSRSHHFRLLLVADLQHFLELTMETDTEQPLPPPKEIARKLRRLAVQTLQSWQGTYGDAYKKLVVGYHFLKKVKKVDFEDVDARTLAERRRQEEKQERLRRIYIEKMDKAKQEMEETCSEIEKNLTELNSCMDLLMPTLSNFHLCDLEPLPNSAHPVDDIKIRSSSVSGHELNADRKEIGYKDMKLEEDEEEGRSDWEEEVPDENVALRSAGLLSHKYSLELNVPTEMKLQETDDNEAVINTMRDLHRLLTTKHRPAVQSWIQVFTKVGDEHLLRRALDYKSSVDTALKRHEGLHICYRSRQRRVVRADDTDDEDFEEVPEKEGYEPHIPAHLRAEYGLEPLPSTSFSVAFQMHPQPDEKPSISRAANAPATISASHRRRIREEEQDPTCAAATLKVLKKSLQQSASSSSACAGLEQGQGTTGTAEQQAEDTGGQKAIAPVVPFGLDLFYWGEEQPSSGKIIKSASQHQFWVPHEMEEEVENEELSAQGKSRYITFAGSFQPVQHTCRAPMPSGTLCQRQDRVKCPFHGLIIPRDECGNPTNPEDAAHMMEEKRKKREQQPDWQDTELMREIEAATGEDLGSSRSYGKGKMGKGSKGKGKKMKYPNLTDLKQSSNTSRFRLEKKVFNKSSMRRVTEVMNKMDRKKHDKFSNQFNYALN